MLADKVVCRLATTDDMIRPTGIPPHVSLLLQVQELNQHVLAVIPAVERIQGTVVDGVTAVLEERAVGANTVTRAGLDELIKSSVSAVLIQSGLQSAVDGMRAQVSGQLPGAPAAGDGAPGLGGHQHNAPAHTATYSWGGGFHIFPEDFKFPDGTILVQWQHWCCGNLSRGWPPLRKLKPCDISNKTTKKRLSDYQVSPFFYYFSTLHRD